MDYWDYNRARALADEAESRANREWESRAKALADSAASSARASTAAHLRAVYEERIAEERSLADSQHYNLVKMTEERDSALEELESLRAVVSVWKLGCLAWKEVADSVFSDNLDREQSLVTLYSESLLRVAGAYPDDSNRVSELPDSSNILLVARKNLVDRS